MTRKPKCVDPEIGGKIPLEISFPIAAGKKPLPSDLTQEPELSPESRHHLEICERCRLDLRKNLALWYQKGASGREMSQAYAIVNAAENGDPTILRRNISAGIAFFKPHAGQTKGLFVLVTDKLIIHDPEEKTLDEFNQMR